MAILDPFTPVSISASILANLATDIIKHFSKDLDDTLAGRILKRVGLLSPSFNDTLRDAIRQALGYYFENHPQYRLTGIMLFFQDPSVSKQLGSYILDRQPINQKEIESRLAHNLGNETVTRLLLKKRGLEINSVIPDFLKCYHRALNEQLDAPQMAILLELLDQKQAVIVEINASEERLKGYITELLEKKLPSLQAPTAPAIHRPSTGGSPQVTRTKKTVFLSHRTRDTAEATRIAEAIRDAGHTVLFDQWDLRVGDSIIAWMNHALTVADCMILCLSQHGEGSFMSREWQAFLHRQLSTGNVRILPIRLTGGDLPSIIADYLLADAVADFDDAINKLLDALEK